MLCRFIRTPGPQRHQPEITVRCGLLSWSVLPTIFPAICVAQHDCAAAGYHVVCATQVANILAVLLYIRMG